MKREDRVALLEALLDRVRANAAARGDRPRSILSFAPPAAPERTPEPAPSRAPPPLARAPDENTMEALSVRAQLLTAFAPTPVASHTETAPAESARAPAAAVVDDGSRWRGQSAIPPPPPDPEDEEVAPALDPVIVEPPPSHLERVVREVTEQLSPLFTVAAEDLREHERRPSIAPSTVDPPPIPSVPTPTGPPAALEPPRSALSAPPAAAPTEWLQQSPDPPAAAEARAPHRASTEPPPAPPMHPLTAPPPPPDAGRSLLWLGVAAGAAIVLAGTWLLQDRRDVATRLPPPPPTVVVVASPPAAATPAATPRALDPTSPRPALPPLPSVGRVPDPPDLRGVALDRGFLWVEAPSPREVYVNGVHAGSSDTWLKVFCGLRNVRTAQPGTPPAGASFPIWTSGAHPVLVPCQSFTRVTMPTDL